MKQLYSGHHQSALLKKEVLGPGKRITAWTNHPKTLRHFTDRRFSLFLPFSPTFLPISSSDLFSLELNKATQMDIKEWLFYFSFTFSVQARILYDGQRILNG